MSLPGDSPVSTLPGVGERKARALAKLGLNTLGDLTEYFPRAYADRRKIWAVAAAPTGEEVCVCATVAAPLRTDYPRRGLSISRTRAFDESGSLTLTFFNQPYVGRRLRRGESFVFCGKIEVSGSRRSMTNPVFEPEGECRITGRIVPIYSTTAGIPAHRLSDWIARALDEVGKLPDDLPPALRQAHGLAERDRAIRTVHEPDSFEALEIARRRLAFEELFCLTAGMALLRSRRRAGEGCLCRREPVERYVRLLSFEPTGAQRRTLEELFADLSSGRVMNRLLQGDVGSGKTAVAAGAIWLAAESDWQSALMAPTEILAEQHFRTLSELLEPAGLRVGLLTAGLSAKEKRLTKAQLAAGELDLIVGTHALLTDDVAFFRLGLVITDEQHRFGVGQRSALSAKGGERHPHVLVMSATPIPRTLSLIIYGDLDVSLLDELPPGRQQVKTYLVGEDKRARMEGFIRRQTEEGHQVYVICPAVEERAESASDLKNVTEYARRLREEVFPDLRIGLVHGRLKSAEKEAAMAAFAAGQTDVLVSTTVVEVGMDVPNATLMVIEDADRFGLSQLHQLRGRVGRGSTQSYCVLLSANRSEETRARLKMLCAVNDGFALAEKDLELRGPGDFFGQRQHGLPQLRVADLATDTRVLCEAKEAAAELLAEDPTLSRPENRPVAEKIRSLFEENQDSFN